MPKSKKPDPIQVHDFVRGICAICKRDKSEHAICPGYVTAAEAGDGMKRGPVVKSKGRKK
jgi:hypothetical protein